MTMDREDARQAKLWSDIARGVDSSNEGPVRTLEIHQDGADFYSGDRLLASYPLGISADYDVAGAAKARDWFEREWCIQYGVVPIFEGP